MPCYGLAPCFPKEKTPGHPQSSLDPHSSLVPVHLIMSMCLLKHSADPRPKAPEGVWSLPRGRLGADTFCRREIIFLWRSPDVILASKGSYILSFTCPSKSTHMLSSGPFKMRTPPEELLSNMLEKTSLCELGSSLLPCWKIWPLGMKKKLEKREIFVRTWEARSIEEATFMGFPIRLSHLDTFLHTHQEVCTTNVLGNSKSSRFRRKINFQTSFLSIKLPQEKKSRHQSAFSDKPSPMLYSANTTLTSSSGRF